MGWNGMGATLRNILNKNYNNNNMNLMAMAMGDG